jgi:hypothetical protein
MSFSPALSQSSKKYDILPWYVLSRNNDGNLEYWAIYVNNVENKIYRCIGHVLNSAQVVSGTCDRYEWTSASLLPKTDPIDTVFGGVLTFTPKNQDGYALTSPGFWRADQMNGRLEFCGSNAWGGKCAEVQFPTN